MAAKEKALGLFKKHHGMLRTAQALKMGIHPRTLYSLRDEGELQRISRGLYRLAEAPELSDPDLATVAAKVPSGVVCLISALSYHGLTTQIPHEIYLAIPRRSSRPHLGYPPIRVFRFSGESYSSGIVTARAGGVALRVYAPAKTVADCFKFRNKIGLEVALEGLREAWRQKKATMDDLWRFAQTCRVSNVMRPYLEGLV